MRPRILLALLLIFAAFATGVARAENANTNDDKFLAAFGAYQKAGHLETEHQFAAALEAYKACLSGMDEIQKSAPQWNPQIIDFRQRKAREAIARIQLRMTAKDEPAPALPGVPANAPQLPAIDHADNFLVAFRAFQSGGEFEAANQLEEALDSYENALEGIRLIEKTAPDWNPSIIEFRQKKAIEAIERVERKLREKDGGASLGGPTRSES